MSRGVRDDIETLRARELASMRGGIWTMTDDEFYFSLARAWDEGAEAGVTHDPTGNPYERNKP